MKELQRSSGVLLHLSSLPNKYGVGTLGEDAYEFVDFLAESRQRLWQILPIGPTGYGNSPYQSYSVFAGNMLFISLERLVEEGLLGEEDLLDFPEFSDKKVEYDLVTEEKTLLLKQAFKTFEANFDDWEKDYSNFLAENYWWLNDYALFRALKETEEKKEAERVAEKVLIAETKNEAGTITEPEDETSKKVKSFCWNDWSEGLKKKDPIAIDEALITCEAEINFHKFVQFIFFRQWFQLKNYANSKGVLIFGDLPLYVSLDSSDVWGNQDIFMLDEEGKMTHVGGVPPDYFSATGQYWGCPIFNWDRLAEREYDWWVARMHFNLRLFDLVRIDHFRGLESFWSIPASDDNAINGAWWPAKGFEMLSLVKEQLGYLPVVAEDLGIITPEVEALRDAFELPGMKVLQFAFAADAKDMNLPHNYGTNFAVYTGTHDNDTTLGWLHKANGHERYNLKKYFKSDLEELPYRLIETAWASVAKIAIVPMQDLLELDGGHRMNTPGTATDNWEWRMEWSMLDKSHKEFLADLTEKYNRVV